MNCIYSIDHRNSKASRQCCFLHLSHHFLPSLSRSLWCWNTASPTEHTPCSSMTTCTEISFNNKKSSTHSDTKKQYQALDLVTDLMRNFQCLPMKYFFITSGVATCLSICVIWPIFSSRLIRFNKSLILTLSGTLGSLYFKYSASEDETRQNSRRRPTKGVEYLPILKLQHSNLYAICK
ncbi:hypothetical protein V8G54_027767 [Vigna mungo]|uniref:Uncharacterized protein n=1 Tax=Vigna mungo TaxID=3915 RepID=A0AAQ3MRD3_VIGMU